MKQPGAGGSGVDVGGPPPRFTTNDFDYDFPNELIAQEPSAQRDTSRLLHLDRRTGAVHHHTFRTLLTLVDPGDVLVVNGSRVIKARLVGTRAGGRPAQVLLVRPEADDTWIAMVHPGSKLKPGRTVRFGDHTQIEIEESLSGGLRRVAVRGASWADLIARFGTVPLPPYIAREPTSQDEARYQTVYARVDGSVAAPTAGLHFTDALLGQLRERGVHVVDLVLHVGPGTFKPVGVADPALHQMHAEWFMMPAATARAVAAAKHAGRRVWAVGTTATRVLETVGAQGPIEAAEGWTDLFIRPPFAFRVVDALLTNFHLPRSTLLMLVCAFGGYDRVMAAYRQAVAARYRLYSYGDCMVIA